MYSTLYALLSEFLYAVPNFPGIVWKFRKLAISSRNWVCVSFKISRNRDVMMTRTVSRSTCISTSIVCNVFKIDRFVTKNDWKLCKWVAECVFVCVLHVCSVSRAAIALARLRTFELTSIRVMVNILNWVFLWVVYAYCMLSDDCISYSFHARKMFHVG